MCSRSKKYCWKLDYQIFFSFRKYDWIEYEDGTVLGRKGQCEGKHFQKETLSTQLFGSILRTLTLFLGSVVSQSFWCCHKLVLPSIYPICLPVCLSIYLYIPVCPPDLTSIYPVLMPAPTFMPAFLPLCRSLLPSVLSSCLSFCPSVFPSISPICLPFCLFVCQHPCLSVCLFVYLPYLFSVPACLFVSLSCL